MTRPNPKDKRKGDRHQSPRIALHLDQPLLDALEAWRTSQRSVILQSEALRTAIREMLQLDGYWPPK